MKIKIKTQNFVDAINWSTKNFDLKNDKAYVSMTVKENGTGMLSHENTSSYFNAPFDVSEIDLDNKEEINLALEGAFLTRLSSALTGDTGEVTLEKDFSDMDAPLKVKSTSGKFTIPTLNAKVKKTPEVKNIGEVLNTDFFDSLQRLSKLCDTKNAGLLPILETIDITLNKDDEDSDANITMMATDRYSLGEISVKFSPDSNNNEFLDESPRFLLPYEVAVLINPSKDGAETIRLVNEPKSKKFGYSFDDGKLALFALKDASPLEYSSYKELGKKQSEKKITLKVADLKKAINVVSSLAWTEGNIHLEFSEESGLVVSDTNGTNRLSVETEELVTTENEKVNFVRTVINEAFSPISTEKMNLRWTDANKPFLLEAVLDDGTVADNVFVIAIPSQTR